MKLSTEAGIGFYSEEGKKIRKSTAYLKELFSLVFPNG